MLSTTPRRARREQNETTTARHSHAPSWMADLVWTGVHEADVRGADGPVARWGVGAPGLVSSLGGSLAFSRLIDTDLITSPRCVGSLIPRMLLEPVMHLSADFVTDLCDRKSVDQPQNGSGERQRWGRLRGRCQASIPEGKHEQLSCQGCGRVLTWSNLPQKN